MDQTWNLDLIWWVTAVELPMLAGLFWLIYRTRSDANESIDDLRHDSETGMLFLRDQFAAYKLEVAKTYASLTHLKETERRLTRHLIRIEDKLDNAAHNRLKDV